MVALGSGGDGYEDRLVAEGIRYHPIPVSRRGINPLSDVWLLLVLLRRFLRDRPDVVHAFTIKPAIFGTIAAACAGVSVRIVTITGLGHAFTTGAWFVRALAQWLYRLSLRYAHVVFFQNADDRALFLELRLVDASKARLVAGSGIDLVRFSLAPLPSRLSGVPTFIMVARLIREKGVHEYLAAAAEAKRHVPDARFLLLGGTDIRNPSALTDEEIERLRKSDIVEWVDEVPDVRPYISQADIVVLPSYREGLPRALLEGAAMGRALLTTDAPGCRELVTDGVTGYVVPIGDANALARAMIKFANSPECIPAMGARARAFVTDFFDETKVIQQTIGVYSECLRLKEAR